MISSTPSRVPCLAGLGLVKPGEVEAGGQDHPARAALGQRGAHGVQQRGGLGAPHLAAVVNQPPGEQVEQGGRIELAPGPVAR